jgi:hypothetical protein
VTYGSGSFSGTEYIDQVSLGDGLVIKNQSIGVASRAQGYVLVQPYAIGASMNASNVPSFTGFDGILG